MLAIRLLTGLSEVFVSLSGGYSTLKNPSNRENAGMRSKKY